MKYEIADEQAMTIYLRIYKDEDEDEDDEEFMTLDSENIAADGDPKGLPFPGKFEICDGCQGKGKHVNRAIDGNGISSSEWAEWSHDDRETYLSGGYDVTCEDCHGQRVVLVVDEERLSEDQKKHYALFEEQAEERARENYNDMITMRGESGYYHG